MNEYKVRFSYLANTGYVKTEEDTSYASTAQEAVDMVRDWYGDLKNLHIERVYVDRNHRWEITEAWE